MQSAFCRLMVAVVVCFPLAALSQPVKLKFANFSPDTERIHNAVNKPFAALVNKAAAGAIEIELFPNGALGRNGQLQAQMVLDGVADIAFVVPPFTPGRFPESEVIELPGLFRNLREATTVFTRMVASGTIRDYKDYFPIAMWGTPPFSIHARFPIKSIADLKGKKIRASGVIQIESLKSLGAVPLGMPPTEVPEAISRRTIDGATSQPAVVFDFGLDRVTDMHYFIRLGSVPLTVLMNRKKFESLPKAGQDAIREYGLEWMASRYSDEYVAYDSELIKRLQADPKRKVLIPSEADQNAARARFEPVIAAWVGKSPRNAELYKAVKAEIEKVRARK